MNPITVTATYQRPVYNVAGAWIRDEPVELVAEVLQDSGEYCSSELFVVWTDETLAKLAAIDFSVDELIGAQEAAEEAYWANEAEECRVLKVRQQLGVVAA